MVNFSFLCSDDYETTLFRAAVVTLFFGTFCPGEVLAQSEVMYDWALAHVLPNGSIYTTEAQSLQDQSARLGDHSQAEILSR